MKRPARVGAAQPNLTDGAVYGQLWEMVTLGGTLTTARSELGALTRAREYQLEAGRLILRLVQDAKADGHTLEEIGRALGMSRQGVSVMLKRAAVPV